jgi:RNA polymerase sigma factor (sigma-70 family)
MSELDRKEIENLIRQIKEGKEELFQRIDPQIRKTVGRVCAQMRVPSYYEEILGSVYERVVKGFDGFQGHTGKELDRWIRKITENVVRGFITRKLKKAPPTVTLDDADNPIDVHTPGHQESVHGHLDLIKFLQTLDPVEGHILLLHSLLDWTFDEIAQVVKLPGYTVRRKYLGILQRLKKVENKT